MLRALTLVLCVLCAAPVALADEKPRVLVLNVQSTGDKPENMAAITALVTHVFDSNIRAATVYTRADLARLIDLEVDKEAVGCETDDSSCLSEVADAMGARFVIYGSMGTIGSGRFVQITLVDVQTTKPLERIFASGPDDLAVMEKARPQLESAATRLERFIAKISGARALVKKQKKKRSTLRESGDDERLTNLRRNDLNRRLNNAEQDRNGSAAIAGATWGIGGVTTVGLGAICGLGTVFSQASSTGASASPLNTAGVVMMICGGGGMLLSGITTVVAGSIFTGDVTKAQEEIDRLNGKGAGKRVELSTDTMLF